MMEVATRRISVDEYYRMAEAGILHPDERVELIDGAIIQMSPIGVRHRDCVNTMTRLLINLLGDRYIVSPQNPVRLGNDTEPVPDVAVVAVQAIGREFRGSDVMLLVEVADTTYQFDRTVKLRKYASASIPEVWIVNLPDNTIEAFDTPEGETYTRVRRLAPGQTLQSHQLPSVKIDVTAILESSEG